MKSNSLLDQLKDIYLPQQISSWWPLAYGWWVLLVVLLLFLLGLFLILHKKRRHRRYIDTVVNDFKSHLSDVYIARPKEVVQSISVYLKRIALDNFAKDDTKLLYGKAWVDYLNSKTKQNIFDEELTEHLVNTYKPQNITDLELEKIVVASEKWLRSVL